MPATIQLTLTAEQAAALSFILNNVGGDPATSPRRHISGIADMLLFQGIRAPLASRSGLLHHTANSIYFAEGSDRSPVYLDFLAEVQALEPRP